MRSGGRVLLALGAVLLAGCLAHRGRTPLEIEPAPAAVESEPWLVVGVAEPVIEMDFPSPHRDLNASESRNEVRLALGLIRSLRATGLYREVDFEGRLHCPPDLGARVRENPPIPGESPDAPGIGFITAGVIPGWYTSDQGHHFTVTGERGERDVDFPWHQTEIFGWVALPLLLWPSWTFETQTVPEQDVFRAFMRGVHLEDLARPPPEGSPSCAAD